MQTIRGVFTKAGLVLGSCLVGLLLMEGVLRLFLPKYEHLADGAYIGDPNLVFIRIPNGRRSYTHPDTGVRHPLFHNNLGLRQHRNFAAADVESSVNIAFFGDSFTENIGMPAHFSFTEPLDYLLNLDRKPAQGNKVGGQPAGQINVLNFGVGGYGTAQSLLRYEMWDWQDTLDHVFYVYFANDPVDDLATGLFYLDDSGRLMKGEAAPSRFALVSGLHLSYLWLDVTDSLAERVLEIYAEREQLHQEVFDRYDRYNADQLPPHAYLMFRLLLRRFKTAVETNGASFHLVWLPMEYQYQPEIATIANEEGIDVFDLRSCFGERDPTHLLVPWYDSPYKFKHDGHWNETGNRLTALCLHRFLEGRLKLPRLSDAEVSQALNHYYSAFQWSGAGGFPADPASVAIRDTYDTLSGASENVPGVPWTPSPQTLVIRSHFDVHLHDGWLAYVREGCDPADFDLGFFLHIVPVHDADLPPEREGFDNRDFSRPFNHTGCTIWRELPKYPIQLIRTGQSSYDEERGWVVSWVGEHIVVSTEAALRRSHPRTEEACSSASVDREAFCNG